MKNQLLLLAIVGGALAVAAPQAHAQLPVTQFDPNATSINGTGRDADTFSVSGNIPEFILLSKVDDKLELGDLGGPQLGQAGSTGNNRFAISATQDSTGGAQSSSGQTHAMVQNTHASGATVGHEGTAGVEIQANTFVKIVGVGTPVVNVGPDGISGTADDITLPTRLRGSLKGRVRYNIPNGSDSGDLLNYSSSPGVTGTTYDKDGYPSYYENGTVGATNTTFNFTFAPGPRPNGSGYDTPGAGGPQNADANDASGFRIAAEVDRHGLNDYKGVYQSTIDLTYYKF